MMEWPASLSPASMVSTSETVAAYAELTNDFNPIHLDAAFAATTPFGRPIVHGTWSLNALGLAMAATFAPDVTARADLDLQFVAPVFVGETIHAGGERRDEAQASTTFGSRQATDWWCAARSGSDSREAINTRCNQQWQAV